MWYVLPVVVGACGPGVPPREFDGAVAFHRLKQQVDFGFRIPGTAAHAHEAAWLDSLLRPLADSLVVQQWTHVTAAKDSFRLTNYLARFRPDATPRLLFLAHWDTRPRSDGPTSRDSTKPVPGASDGASGVSVLLGVADALKKMPPKVGVDLLFVDGEDFGSFEKTPDDVLIGSRYYAHHMPPGDRPLFAVLVDMVGDKDLGIYQEGNSVLGAPEVVDKVWDTARRIGHGQYFVPSPKHVLTDDHVELQKVGIRAIDVVDFDYPYWHTPEDTPDKTSAQSLTVVGDVILALIRLAGAR